MRILIVEDEVFLAEAIEQILKKNNYAVDLAHNGEYGLDCGLSGIYDIIILDIMLPKMNGIDVLKELRKNKIQAPVILLTAKGDTQDKIDGLDSGADDYLPKAFKRGELFARLRALGRRIDLAITSDVLECGNTQLDPQTLFLSCKGKQFKLALKEYQTLELLLKHKGMILFKEIFIEKLWRYDADAEDNNVEIYISFLRKKLKSLSSDIVIQTIRGTGYVLRVEESGANHV